MGNKPFTLIAAILFLLAADAIGVTVPPLVVFQLYNYYVGKLVEFGL